MKWPSQKEREEHWERVYQKLSQRYYEYHIDKEKVMEERARIALEKSIKEKWIPLASGSFLGAGEPPCALCEEFDSGSEEDSCIGCPVWDRTGRTACKGTPYYSWAYCEATEYNHPDRVAAAKEELEFLRSLLPKKGFASYMDLEREAEGLKVALDKANSSSRYWFEEYCEATDHYLTKSKNNEIEELKTEINRLTKLVNTYAKDACRSKDKLNNIAEIIGEEDVPF